MVFTLEVLQMLFDETALDFNAWAEENHYSSDWSDQVIYDCLPEAIKSALGDFGINASWMHDGM